MVWMCWYSVYTNAGWGRPGGSLRVEHMHGTFIAQAYDRHRRCPVARPNACVYPIISHYDRARAASGNKLKPRDRLRGFSLKVVGVVGLEPTTR